jgi:hypothetical protein
MSTRAKRIIAAAVTTLTGAVLVLLLGGRHDARAIAGSLVIGAGVGAACLLRARPGCRPFRRSPV